jgi:hypothetical protein
MTSLKKTPNPHKNNNIKIKRCPGVARVLTREIGRLNSREGPLLSEYRFTPDRSNFINTIH